MEEIIRNRIKIIGNDYQQVVYKILNGRNIDFNKIIKMPEVFNNEELPAVIADKCMKLFINSIKATDEFRKYLVIIASTGNSFISTVDDEYDNLMSYCLNYKENNKNIFDSKEQVLNYGRQCYDKLAQYGYAKKIDWLLDKWGCPTNADNTNIQNNIIIFDTKSRPVPELVCELSTMFPELIFEYDFVDDQAIFGSAELEFKNGGIYKENYFEKSNREYFEKYFELFPNQRRNYKFNIRTNAYEKKEDYME